MPKKSCSLQERPLTRRSLLSAWGVAAVSTGWLGSAGMAQTAAAELPWPAQRPARAVRRVDAVVLLAITQAGSRLVACGERGAIAYSDDGGATWTQASVPVSVTLTALKFVNAQLGWAVGHAGVILHTRDGGSTWLVQSRTGREGDENAELFAVHFEDEHRGLAVGAFGLVMKTSDGGSHWSRVSFRSANPRDLHVYSVCQNGRSVCAAGEQGLFMHSQDGGESFSAIQTPYAGSYFCQAIDPDGNVILGGAARYRDAMA
jgi:photosystem II stability/assembly factor-like uncharacterized protein